PVVVGTLGNDLRVEFKAVGDTVNLASRMEAQAQPGATYITEDTFKLTEGLFRFEGLGQRVIKGKEEPINIYRVIAPSTRRTRFDVSADRGLTPFVGRQRELELLVDGFERAKAGRGQAFSIVSEAGVGKSRLLYEFRKAVAHEDVTFLEGKCLSYSKGVPYHLLIDTLKANFDITEREGDSEIREKVKKGIKIVRADEDSILPYFLELLSVKDSGIDKIPMSPEAKKDRIIEAFKQIALKGSEIRPLIMANEDLHWMDKSSEDVLKYVLESIPGVRILLIFTYRPEYVHTWGARSYHSQVTLNRLSNRESLVMTTNLLGTKEIDGDLEDLILEKTEGIPFFIEEFIKSLKDLYIIERKDNKYHLAKDIQQVTLPSTIQEVIMARVDSLPEGAKELLQTCSVIEREFSYELIKRVTNLSQDELLSHLSALKGSELLYERGIYPESTYIFKHALTREVVYDSILTKRKKKIHENIGDTIEKLYKEHIDEYYGVLVEHFILSENHKRAAEYARLAARKAEKAVSFLNAISYATKRVSCLEKLTRTEDIEKRLVNARTILGFYLVQKENYIEAKEAVEPIVELAMKQNNKRSISQIYSIIGAFNVFVEENSSKSIDYLKEAVRISDEIQDFYSFVFSTYLLGLTHTFNCEFEEAYGCLKKVIDINVKAKILWGISIMKSLLSMCVYYLTGRIEKSYQNINEALRIAEKSGDAYSKAFAYSIHGVASYGKGLLEEATKHLKKAVELCERVNVLVQCGISEFYLAETLFEAGEYQKAKSYFGKAIWRFEHNRVSKSWANLAKICMVKAKVMNNERDIHLGSLYDYSAKNKLKLYDGWMQRYIGQILLLINDNLMVEAEDWIQKAIDSDKQNGMKFELGQDYGLYAELYKRKGYKSRAKESFIKAIEILDVCGADGWVEKYEKELEGL
ncbi:MAG: AAA family ATPase, partial [Desulfobacterales bacterium]